MSDDPKKVIRMPGTADHQPLPMSAYETLLFEIADLREEVTLLSKYVQKLVRILKEGAQRGD